MHPTDLLLALQDEGLLTWPIDFEAQEPSEEDAADTLGYWFDGKDWRAGGQSFIQFGQDGTGSLFCLWMYPGLEGEPPVVFFGSEGEVGLIAANVADFTRRLCSGLVWDGYDGSWVPVDEGEIEDDDEDALDLQALRARAQEVLGVWGKGVDMKMQEAIAKQPDFKGWVAGVLG